MRRFLSGASVHSAAAWRAFRARDRGARATDEKKSRDSGSIRYACAHLA